MTTWKLNASVPTIAIITSGIHSSVTLRAYASPARTWRLPRSATGDRRISAGFISNRPTITADVRETVERERPRVAARSR